MCNIHIMYLFTFLQSIVWTLSQWQEKEVGKEEKSWGAQKNERAGKKMAGQNTLSFSDNFYIIFHIISRTIPT